MISKIDSLHESQVRSLSTGQIDVWIASISKLAHYTELLQPLLLVDEMLTAMSFHRPQDKKRYIMGRGLLRYLIIKYLRISNYCIQFRYEKYGKPVLINADLEFNLSHSQNLIAIALTNLGHIGIDIEYKQSELDNTSLLLSSISSTKELSSFQQIPEHQKTEAFYRIWTIKEAYGKALGKGLHDGLREISIFSSKIDIMKSEPLSNFAKIGKYFVLSGFPLEDFSGALVSQYLPRELNFTLLI